MRTLAMLLSSYSQPIEEAGELKGVISVSGQRSMWKTLAVWVGVFVVILFIVHTVMVIATRKRLEAELAYLKSKGEPLTLRELVGPKIPDAENGAVIYEQAFQMMKLPQMQNHVEAITAFDPATTDAQEWVKISPSLAKVQPIFVIAANAQERSKCQFDVDWDAGAAAVFPHYADLRKLVRLLAVDAVAKARAGKSEEAINSLKLAYRLNRSIENDPILIGLLVQIVMIRIANNAMRSCTEQANFSENSAKMLYDELGKIDLPRGLVRAMQGERALGIWCFNKYRPPGWNDGVGVRSNQIRIKLSASAAVQSRSSNLFALDEAAGGTVQALMFGDEAERHNTGVGSRCAKVCSGFQNPVPGVHSCALYYRQRNCRDRYRSCMACYLCL